MHDVMGGPTKLKFGHVIKKKLKFLSEIKVLERTLKAQFLGNTIPGTVPKKNVTLTHPQLNPTTRQRGVTNVRERSRFAQTSLIAPTLRVVTRISLREIIFRESMSPGLRGVLLCTNYHGVS